MSTQIVKQMSRLDKEELLSLTNGGLDFYKFVIPDIELNDKKGYKPTYCPFYDDTKASFSLYFNYDKKRWNHKDHGSSPDGISYGGDVFDFAACYYNLNIRSDFHLIMKKIASDLNIQLPALRQSFDEFESWCDDLKFVYHGNPEDQYAWLMGFELFYRGANNGIDLAHGYFKKFGISKEILKEYNVRAIDWYKKVDGDGNVECIRIWKKFLSISYVDVHFAKFYNPGGSLRFWYVGSKPQDYAFGRKQILRRLHKSKICQEVLIITGGEKDVLTLTSLGYDAICFNSETASVPKDVIENLFPLYKKIVILFDIDDTGKRRSQELVNELSQKFSVICYTLPDELTERKGKDISDYVAEGMDVKKIKREIDALTLAAEKGSILNTEALSNEPAQILQQETPLFPESVYNKLPNTLKTICRQFKSSREKDLVLLSSLATISSFFPNVKGKHGGKKVGCNFFLFITAPASSGKGVMTWSRILGNGIQHHLKEKYKAESKKFSVEYKEYLASRKDNPNAEEPEKPKQQVMFIPANISVSMLTQMLDANQNFGVIFETEGDTLANVLNTEWGNFSDVLRRAFHHEPITLARRGNGEEHLVVENPHLSVILSGTESQVGNLIKDVENGFFSRMLFYSFRSKIEWQNQFVEYSDDLEEIFNTASLTMFEYWHIQANCKKCMVIMPGQYINEINNYFSHQLKHLVTSHGDGIVASVKRFGLNFYRIAMVLSVIRQLDEHKCLPETITINEGDFKISRQIIDVLLAHLKIVYSKLETASRTLKLNNQQKRLFEGLPEDFTRQQFDKIAEFLNIKYKTAERYLNIYLKQELISRYDQGKYQKI